MGLVACSRAPGLLFAPDDNVAPDVGVDQSRAAGGGAGLGRAPARRARTGRRSAVAGRHEWSAATWNSKLKLYSRQGVQEYWIVDWRLRTVQIYRRHEQALVLVSTAGDGDTITSPMPPSFSLRIDDIWEPQP